MVLCIRDGRWHSWRWKPILEKWGHLRMFVDPKCINSAAFIIENGEPASTVFFVKMPLNREGPPQAYADYAVTTKHSVKDRHVSIRLNVRRGGPHDEPINPNDWVPHPDTDIAVLPITFPLDEYE